MHRSREEIRADILPLLRKLAGDWEYAGEITEDTSLFADLGFESLDLVVLGTQIQQYYDKILPFPEFYAELGERGQQDVSVAEWVDFVHEQLNEASGKTQ
jgi:acyl carrier protein